MIKNRILAAAFALVLPLLMVPATVAQEKDDPVLVRVGDHDIRVSEVRLAAESITEQLTNVPANARFVFLVQYLIERHLLAQEAVKRDIESDPEYQRLMTYYKAKAARDAFFTSKIQPQVTDQTVRAEYDKQAAAVDNQEKVHLRHILVSDEATAKKVHAQLQSGGDFAKLANENSPNKDAQDGGDLGWLAADEMFPEFVEVAAKLNTGEYSKPVETKFGWHVIKLEGKKTTKAQPFDKVKGGLTLMLTRIKVQEMVTALRKNAKIEIVHPDLKKLENTEDDKAE